MAENKVPDLPTPSPKPASTAQPATSKPAVGLDVGQQASRMPEGRILEVDEHDAGPELALDLSGGELVRPSAAALARAAAPRKSVEASAPKRGARWPWLLLFVAIVAGGGALERTEQGAFFRHKIDALIHADERALLTQETIEKVRDALGADTAERGSEAVTTAEDALARAPRHKPLLAWAAYTVFAHELRFGRDRVRHDRALGWLARAGDHPNAHLAAAARDLLHNESDKARASLARAPHEVDAKLLLGQLELVSKHPKEAVAAFEEALKLEPTTRTRASFARALETIDPKRAGETAAALAEEAKSHVGARLILGRLSYRNHDQAGLARWVKELGPLEKLGTAGERSELFTLRGLHALDRKEPLAARAAFDESIKLAAGVVSAYIMVGLGDLDLAAGKAAEARVHYETALSADAGLTHARLGLASTLIALGKLDEARTVLDTVTDPTFAAEAAKLRAQATVKPKKK